MYFKVCTSDTSNISEDYSHQLELLPLFEVGKISVFRIFILYMQKKIRVSPSDNLIFQLGTNFPSLAFFKLVQEWKLRLVESAVGLQSGSLLKQLGFLIIFYASFCSFLHK